jgi:hypothetical protein
VPVTSRGSTRSLAAFSVGQVDLVLAAVDREVEGA